MKINVPNLGNTNLAVKALFDSMGIDYIISEESSEKALEIGSKYSPEDICLPYKIMLGNILISYKKGADTVLITGSGGPCRYGEYCELMRNILKKLKLNLNLIVIDYPKNIGMKEFLRRISEISKESNVKLSKKIMAVNNALKIIKLIDYIEIQARYRAGYEVKRGSFKKLLYECKRECMDARNSNEMLKLLYFYKNQIKCLKIDKNRKPVSIAIIGEIYTILEPFANLHLEDKLMELGVSVKKGITPSWWVKDAILAPLKLNSMKIRKASKPYLPEYIGGHAKECIGEAVIASEENIDGAIQIFPLGCMPEIVAKSILPNISKEKNFPIMSLVVDEMTGEAGYDTRLEAFVDMIERRKSLVSKNIDRIS
ncbi:MAG: acyl-CoA dehydratase activase-related protein [Clostridium sp.]|nr:acyl-CoA dehydratase activase-related protein [Clostridium sp.]